MSVREDLITLGGKPMGSFDQMLFKTEDKVEGVDLTSGYCSGVVLDWTRRVLQSSGDRDVSYLSFSSPGYTLAIRRATVKRMAIAHDGRAQNYVTYTQRTKGLLVLQQMKSLPMEDWPGYGTGVPVLFKYDRQALRWVVGVW
jgi:hypothetical protein